MKTYKLWVVIMSSAGWPVLKEFHVLANSFTMAAGICKGQTALDGRKIVEIVKYEVAE